MDWFLEVPFTPPWSLMSIQIIPFMAIQTLYLTPLREGFDWNSNSLYSDIAIYRLTIKQPLLFVFAP
jgi:hypothetical protein